MMGTSHFHSVALHCPDGVWPMFFLFLRVYSYFFNRLLGKSPESQTTRHSSRDGHSRNVGGEAGPRGANAAAPIPFPPLLLRSPRCFKTKGHHLGLHD